jgi:peptidoglycan/xylan/chitin deacetylase (PgdA/CDA1 family)
VAVALATLGIIGVLVTVLYGLPQLYRAFQVRQWRGIKGKLALTYDDGPDDLTTEPLLDLLDELKAAATFYLVGCRGEARPKVLARLRASRHELGTHSHSHRNAWKSSPLHDYRDAMAAYDSLAACVEPTSPFRPPFGKTTLPTLLGMWYRGRRVEWWSVPTNDHADPTEDAAKHACRILDRGETVVLMHCRHTNSLRRTYMLELTRALVKEARARGVELVTMKQIAEQRQ